MKVLRKFIPILLVFSLVFLNVLTHGKEIVQSVEEAIKSENTIKQPTNRVVKTPGLNFPFYGFGVWGSVKDITTTSLNYFVSVPLDLAVKLVDSSCKVFKSINWLLPDPTPNKESLKFILKDVYSFGEFNVPLEKPSQLLSHQRFRPDRPLVIFVTGWNVKHRWNEWNFRNFVLDILAKAHEAREINFVAINSAEFIDTWYSWSAFNTERVGGMIGESLETIIQTYPLENIHLIGHSIGAHIAGSVGRYIFRKTGRKIPRITGLDSANPCFNTRISLSKEDAEFVDVIHSNSGVLGQRLPMGHVDFYPNGLSRLPPGCSDIVCAHFYAVELYAESVRLGNEQSFIANKCSNLYSIPRSCTLGKAVMGYAAHNTTRGIYYMKTNGASQYTPYGNKKIHRSK